MSLPAGTRRRAALSRDRAVAVRVLPKPAGEAGSFRGRAAGFLFMRSDALIQTHFGTGKYADFKG